MISGRDGLDVESIRFEIARIAPELVEEPVACLGEGMDSLAVSVGGAFVFRFAKHADAAAGLRREIALLPRLAPRLHFDVPRFELVGEHSLSGLPFVGYRLIRGEPLDRTLYDGLSEITRDGILDELAGFLRAVHAFPVREARGCGVIPHGERPEYLEDLRRAQDDVFPLLESAVRNIVESEFNTFLEDDANFSYAPALLHADLWPEHVLFSQTTGRLAGIIDFGDMCIGDPDYDLAFLARRLGQGFITGLLRHHLHSDPARLAGKIRFFGLFNAIGDIFIGLERNDVALVESAVVDFVAQCVGDRECGIQSADVGLKA
jgi:aminoglycoside 2''-phosphotransferase